MYYEIQKLTRLGFSKAKIARHLVMDARTVTRYQNMDEEEYEQHLVRSFNRKKVLSAYEDFVTGKLTLFPDTSTAQLHDWLKEAHAGFGEVSPRTVNKLVH